MLPGGPGRVKWPRGCTGAWQCVESGVLARRRYVEALAAHPPDKGQQKDMDFLLNLGELFTLVVYAQLIIESAGIQGTEDELLDQIFDFMVRDFSRHSLSLYSTTSTTQAQAERCLAMIHRPARNDERFDAVWQRWVLAQDGVYEMKR